jgi:hypothetical protein
MNILIYRIFFVLMLISYAGLSLGAADWKSKLIGILLLVANALIFFK